jgi:hypothetical protein
MSRRRVDGICERQVLEGRKAGRTILDANHADTYTANAAGMWSRLAPTIAAPDGVLGLATPEGDRYVLRRPLARDVVAALLEALPPGSRAVVEDSYGAEPVPVNKAPRPHLQPWARAQALPPRVLDLPG